MTWIDDGEDTESYRQSICCLARQAWNGENTLYKPIGHESLNLSDVGTRDTVITELTSGSGTWELRCNDVSYEGTFSPRVAILS